MSYEFIDDGRKVKVRKNTICEWCGEAINKGDIAVNRVYKWEGTFNSTKQHIECNQAMAELEFPDEGFSVESMERPQPPQNQDKE